LSWSWEITTVSVTIISHCEISFWLAWSTIWLCNELIFFNFKAATKREIQSITVEIQIQIHARVLASLLSDMAITIAKINKSHHSHTIPRRKDWVSLLFNQKIISVTHLIKAHKAKIQIIIVQTSWDQEKINQNQIKASKNHPIQSTHTRELFLFLKALIIADIPEVSKKNHNIISINFQNILGEYIVIIQKIIIIVARESINQKGRTCFHVTSSIQKLIN